MNALPYKDRYITLQNYKEPLKDVKGGFGYYGTISATTDGEGVVCHICGEIFSDLSRHVIGGHKIGVKEYKVKFQLSQETSLLSEKVRMERKNRALLQYKQMTPEQRLALYENRRYHKGKKRDMALSVKNKRGSCPDQILAQIEKCYLEIGKVPTKIEFIDWSGSERFTALASKTFGSWSKALSVLGLELTQRHNGGMKHKWSKEELIELVRIFYQENGVVPTEGDCKRGLIPSQSVFYRHFGGLKNARDIAFN